MENTCLSREVRKRFRVIKGVSPGWLAAGEVDVYLLGGQSNMQGHAHVRTMDVIGLDPKTAPMLEEMRNADGTPRVCDDVWISSIGSSEEEKTGKLTAGFGASPLLATDQARGASVRPDLSERPRDPVTAARERRPGSGPS